MISILRLNFGNVRKRDVTRRKLVHFLAQLEVWRPEDSIVVNGVKLIKLPPGPHK